MIRLGITGGIGMGKSACAGALRALGVPVVDTDDLAREVVAPGSPALAQIADVFGSEVLMVDGTLDRKSLAEIVFADPVKRADLEAITHPRIREAWQAHLESWRAEGAMRAAVVIPLLYETKAEECFDRIICVACTPATQRDRLRKRGWSETEISNRLAAQLDTQQKLFRAHFVVWTEGSIDLLSRQLELILGQ